MSAAYAESYARSVADPEAFWMAAAGLIDWAEPPLRAQEAGGWFAGARLNICDNAVDRHARSGRGKRPALIYDSPVTGIVRSYTFSELEEEVARTAGMLAALGVGKGDRVIIYMPMVPEAVFAMLACARIGAVHSVVFGGFASPELAKRIDDAEPRLLLTASCGIEGSRVIEYKPLVDRALEQAQHRVGQVVVLQRPQVRAAMTPGRDGDWASLRAAAERADCVAIDATDPLYILHTSGTTGTPKGVVREAGGYAVALAWSMANIYGVRPGETFWAASDVGWVVGHSYLVYGPLLAGCATVLYEGKPVGTPDAGAFWRTIARHSVDVFFAAPTALRAIRKEDPDGRLISDLGTGRLRALFLAGERADPDTIEWAETRLKLPVIDHWWQTELGWPAAGTCLGLGDERRRAGSAGMPVPGFRFAVLDDSGRSVPANESGHIVIKTPLPPGCYTALWNNPEGYQKAFATFPGYYETGDAGHVDVDGFLNIMGRTDDLINVAGHRLSTGQMEQVIAGHPAVAECAVVGIPDAVKGAVPIAFAVAKHGFDGEEASLPAEFDARIRAQIGPIATLRRAVMVRALPKTRSGKILRATLRQIAAGNVFETPPTIEDASVITEIADRYRSSG